MESVVAHFALDSDWASEMWEFGEWSIDWCVTNNGLDAGDK
jgi:hypothetical protein